MNQQEDRPALLCETPLKPVFLSLLILDFRHFDRIGLTFISITSIPKIRNRAGVFFRAYDAAHGGRIAVNTRAAGTT